MFAKADYKPGDDICLALDPTSSGFYVVDWHAMEKYLFIGLGGFLGVNLRYLLQAWTASRWGASFPYGTLIINVTGSLILGFFVTLVTQRVVAPANWRLFVTVGLLGGYTTFATFSVETLNLLQAGRWVLASAYLFGNVFLGLAGAFVGMILARAL